MRQDQWQAISALAEDQIQDGRPWIARILTTVMSELVPTHSRPTELLGLIAESEGNENLAINLLSEAFVERSESTYAPKVLCRLLVKNELWGDLERVLNEADNLEPLSNWALDLAERLKSTGAPERAKKLLLRLNNEAPRSIPAYIKLARFYQERHQFDDMDEVLDRLKLKRPEELFGTLGQFLRYQALGQNSEALRTLDEIEEDFQNSPHFKMLRCDTVLALRDLNAARDAVQQLEGSVPGRRIFQYQLRLAALEQNWEKVVSMLGERDELTVSQSVALSFAYIFLDQREKATKHLTFVETSKIPLHRRWSRALRNLAEFKSRVGAFPTQDSYTFSPCKLEDETTPPAPVVRSLWVGDDLSLVEQLSIKSWLANGFTFELFSYDLSQKVPDGCVLRDAREIMPVEEVFRHSSNAGRSQGSYAGFADLFRWRMLSELGGFWSDCDIVCLKPFDLWDTFVCSSELARTDFVDHSAATNCFLGGPAEHPIFREAVSRLSPLDHEKLLWGEAGTVLLGDLLQEFKLETNVLPSRTFNPIGPFKILDRMFDPESTILEDLEDGVLGIHLYNEVWRSARRSKNGPFPPNSPMSKLLHRFGIEPG